MADLDDLGFTSISEMTSDEGLELLRQIRLSRRVPVKSTKTTTKKKESPKVSSEQAAELLKLIMGDSK